MLILINDILTNENKAADNINSNYKKVKLHLQSFQSINTLDYRSTVDIFTNNKFIFTSEK